MQPAARWLLAEGADAAKMTRSVPLAKAMDDVIDEAVPISLQCPTDGVAAASSSSNSARLMRPARSSSAGPIPDSINNCGEFSAPPHTITSRRAITVRVTPPFHFKSCVLRPIAAKGKNSLPAPTVVCPSMTTCECNLHSGPSVTCSPMTQNGPMWQFEPI